MVTPDIWQASRTEFGDDFSIEPWLNRPKGVIIFDAFTANTAYVFANRSRSSQDIFAAMRGNKIIPINANIFSVLGEDHLLLNRSLIQNNLPSIPLWHIQQTEVAEFDHDNIATIPNIYVRKRSGLGVSHGGKGVSTHLATQPPVYLLEGERDFLQRFVKPPTDGQGNTFVRDYRVMMVEGEPVTSITRRAALPLTRDMLNGQDLPTEEYFPTRAHPGVIELPDTAVKKLLYPAARAAIKWMPALIKAFPNQPYAPASPLGYCSVDFLIDAKGVPAVVDFDVSPGVRAEIMPALGQSVARHLLKLAKSGMKQRDVLVLGEPTSEYAQCIVHNLLEQRSKGAGVYWQQVGIKRLMGLS